MVHGLGHGVQGVGSRVDNAWLLGGGELPCRPVDHLGFRVWGLGFQGFGVRVEAFRLRV